MISGAGKDRSGGCQCGAVRYEILSEPLVLYVCHCRECQKQSASAFGLSLSVPRSGFRITQGAPVTWSRVADSGGTVVCAFCPTCGSRLWHERAADPEVLTVKAGSLDEPVDLRAAIHIWTSRRLPGLEVPQGVRQFPEEPD